MSDTRSILEIPSPVRVLPRFSVTVSVETPYPSPRLPVLSRVPFFRKLNFAAPPTRKEPNALDALLAVSVLFIEKELKTTPALFHVCVMLRAGAEAVRVPDAMVMSVELALETSCQVVPSHDSVSVASAAAEVKLPLKLRLLPSVTVQPAEVNFRTTTRPGQLTAIPVMLVVPVTRISGKSHSGSVIDEALATLKDVFAGHVLATDDCE